MQGELTSRLSSSWMYIAYAPLLFWFMQKERKIVFSVCTPLLMNWQKGGEKFGVFICMFVLLVTFTIGIKIGIKSIFYLLVSRGIFCCIFWLVSRTCLFHWYQISCLCIFMFEYSLHIFMFIVMHELKESFYEA